MLSFVEDELPHALINSDSETADNRIVFFIGFLVNDFLFLLFFVLRIRQMPVSVFDHHDPIVHHHSDRQCDSCDGHDVG